MRNQQQTNERGITLIELVVVMVIIGLFATLVGQQVFNKVGKARTTEAKAQVQEFESVLDMFRLDVGRYPSTDEGLQALQVKPSGVENWDGPYLKREIPLDPWGKAYIYKSPGQHGEYDLLSYGKDGQEGGDGEAADVVSWK